MTLTQVSYDSENQLYKGTLNINLRLAITSSLPADTTILTFNTTKWKPWHGTIYPCIVSTSAASGTLTWGNLATNTNGNVQIRNANTSTSTKYLHFNATIEVCFLTDLKTWSV